MTYRPTPGNNAAKMVAYIREHGPDIRAGAIAKHVGVKSNSVHGTLGLSVAAGLVTFREAKMPNGRPCRLYSINPAGAAIEHPAAKAHVRPKRWASVWGYAQGVRT